MAQLLNPNLESFCIRVASGQTPIFAYQAVYPFDKTPQIGSKRAFSAPKNRVRIAELRQEMVRKALEKRKNEGELFITNDLKDREVRIKKLTAVVNKLESVIESRATLYSKMPNAEIKLPGAGTGLVIPTFSGGKMTSQIDSALIKEYRAIIQQINEECGPDMVNWEQDDGLKALAGAIINSPTEEVATLLQAESISAEEVPPSPTD